MHIYPIDSYRWFLVIPMYWDEFSRPILERPRRWPSHHLARSKGWGARITWWKCSKKKWKKASAILEVSWHFEIISIHLWVPSRLHSLFDKQWWYQRVHRFLFKSKLLIIFDMLLVQFWCSFGAVRSRHRHCDWEIRRLECRWSPTLWPKTWQHTLRRFRHSKSPAFLSEMICHVWPLVWYVLINDDQW
jgi:hypothetical protein